MRNKTALQQAIEKASHYANDQQPHTRERGLVLAVISEMNLLLETEKKQIKDAYLAGGIDGIPAIYTPSTYSEQYYTSTYNEK
jgi:hypothetical protein